MSMFNNKKSDDKTDNKPPKPAAFKKPATGGKQVDKRNKSLQKISVISTIVFIVAALVVNILFDSLLGDKLRWDWSANEKYSVGEISEEILKGLETDVEIIGLFDKDTDQTYTDIQLLLSEYQGKSAGKLTVRYVDPDTNPTLIAELDPDGYYELSDNMFAVYCPATQKVKVVEQTDIFDYQYDQTTYQSYLAGITAEESFTGAIKYVISENTPVLYFTTGHDELSFESNYSMAVSAMQNNNFNVAELELLNLSEIPEDCAALVMAEPTKDITQGEKSLISNYLEAGGSLLVIAGFSNTDFPVLNELLLDFNLEISQDKIREGNVDYRYNNDPYSIRAIAPTSTITQQAVDGWTLMSNVRGFNILSNEKTYIVTEAILTTSNEGVAEQGGDVNSSSQAGTQTVAVLSENEGWWDGQTVTETAKVMLLGSSDLISDNLLGQYGNNIYNFGLFYYGVQWLTNIDADSDLRIDAKEPVSLALTSGTQGGYNFAAIFSLIILPVIILLAALFVYRKRKHL